MPDFVCSLITQQGIKQTIPPSDGYTLVRFPFDVESSDDHGMHPEVQPDTGETVTYISPRSGLIWPCHTAWGQLYALMYWDAGPYTEVRSRFVRDPLGLTQEPDSTCTEDHPDTVGGQYRAKSWGMWVRVGQPLGLMVRHNADVPVRLAFAEFKVAYHLDPAPVPPV
ncbi:hypothetical protein [Planobispora longispora]|uniref:Uncharacterized protein n=1 Tax=Planobispora longispora TaxID=28887 RepID=A0A8J3W558_9ACTN|nr:hypothetical protein [Planobispora longispora]BFE85842.1 hypothetical protein GCM10020093_084430 [Planobispora longispora]GIH76128.1 hypothetical protein Plo01_25570 [Planobispora longispora]